MTVDAVHLHVLHLFCFAIERQSFLDGHAELVLIQSGGDIWVSSGIHVRIDAKRNGRTLSHRLRDPVDGFELGLGFHVETEHSGFQRPGDLRSGLSHSGKHRAACLPARGQHSFQLAGRNNVETGSQTREHVQHGKVGIGLYGITDQMIDTEKRLMKSIEAPLERRARIHVARRAITPGDLFQGDTLGVKHAVHVSKKFRRHLSVLAVR